MVASATPAAQASPDFSNMTADEIKAFIAQRRTEYNAATQQAKKLGVITPSSKGDGPKTLVPELSALARRVGYAHVRTREAQQEEDALRGLYEQGVQAYCSAQQVRKLPKEVQTELDGIIKDLGEVELKPWAPKPKKAKKVKAPEATEATTLTTDGTEGAAPNTEEFNSPSTEGVNDPPVEGGE